MDELIIIARFCHFCAMALLIGLPLFWVVILPKTLQHDGDFVRWMWRVERYAIVLAFFSAISWFVAVVRTLASIWNEKLGLNTFNLVLFDTHFGQVWSWRLAVNALLMALLFMSKSPPTSRLGQAVMLSLIVLLVGSLAEVGHALVSPRGLITFHFIADIIHLLCASAWVGGLVGLGYSLKRVARNDDVLWEKAVPIILSRFSGAGYAIVGLLVLSGGINAIILLPSISSLYATVYGRILLLKLVFVAIMVMIALMNRMVFTLRLLSKSVSAGGQRIHAALSRSVIVEQIVGLLVLAIVALLGTVSPTS